jgi:hypothetical protein
VVPRPGPGGASVLTRARIVVPGGEAQVLFAYRPDAVARDIPALKSFLANAAEQLARKPSAEIVLQLSQTPLVGALATDAAPPSVIHACLREGLGLIDRKGTVLLRVGSIFVHVIGRAPVERRTRWSPFGGKAARLVRLLLKIPELAWTAQAMAKRAEISYAAANYTLKALERDGLVFRRSPRTGYVLRDAVALLQAWINSGRKTALAVEGFHAPSTRPEILAQAEAARHASGVTGIFTLASALDPKEVFVSGLPHGIYLAGDSQPIIKALQLRRITPHNFLILRADPAAETEAGGIYLSPRLLPAGYRGVALPQLAVDFAHIGGRGAEQSQHLVELYAKASPLVLP